MDRPFCSELKDGIFLAGVPKRERFLKIKKEEGFKNG